MKNLLLITVFISVLATKLIAQEDKAIKINHLKKEAFRPQSLVQKENHQFEIVAKEDLDVNLRFNLKEKDNINIEVTDNKDRILLLRKFEKEGNNRLAFSMSQNEKYIVKLSGEKKSNLTVSLSED